ncbi:MAG: hypothetical protein N3E49_05305 [Bacteroidia bacterium]|nr:hypothetical protein [Bacteroidia bacterium]
MLEVLVVFVVIGLPVVGGLALAAYQRWLKHKERMPISPERLREIDRELRELRRENDNLRRRIQNLETIIANIDWDRLLAQESQSQSPHPPLLSESSL